MNKFDQNSATWHSTLKFLKEKQAMLRDELEDPKLGHDDTQVIRGQLLFISSMIEQGADEISRL